MLGRAAVGPEHLLLALSTRGTVQRLLGARRVRSSDIYTEIVGRTPLGDELLLGPVPRMAATEEGLARPGHQRRRILFDVLIRRLTYWVPAARCCGLDGARKRPLGRLSRMPRSPAMRSTRRCVSGTHRAKHRSSNTNRCSCSTKFSTNPADDAALGLCSSAPPCDRPDWRRSAVSWTVGVQHFGWGCVEVDEDPRSERLVELNGDLALLAGGRLESGRCAHVGCGGHDGDSSV